MSILSRPARVAILVLLALTLVGGSAQAFELDFDSGGRIEATGRVTLSDEGRVVNVACNSTLAGTLATAAITASRGTTFGNLTSGSATGCTGGTVTLLGPRAERPWSMQFERIAGTLPDLLTQIEFRVNSVGIELEVTIMAMRVRCLYSGTLQELFTVEGSPPQRTSSIVNVANAISFSSGSRELCPRTLRMSGTLTLRPTQSIRAGPNLGWTPARPFEFGGIVVGGARTQRVTARNDFMFAIRIRIRLSAGCASGDWRIEGLAEVQILERETTSWEQTFRPGSRGIKICDVTLVDEAGLGYTWPATGNGL